MPLYGPLLYSNVAAASVNNFDAIIGDSRAAQQFADPATQRTLNARHFWNVANALNGHRRLLAGNWGVSGKRTDEVQSAQLNSALNSNPGKLIIICGVNDITQNYPTAGTSGATAAANIKSMCNSALQRGVQPEIILDTGATSMSSSQIGQLHELNERLIEFAEATAGVTCYDPRPLVWDPNNSDTALAFLANMSTDGTHFGNLGGWTIGKDYGTNVLNQTTKPLAYNKVVNRNQLTPLQQSPNPLFETTTGGTTGGSGTVTGTPPSGIKAVAPGSSSMTVSVPANAGGFGNDIKMVATSTASTDVLQFQRDVAGVSFGAFPAGTIFQAMADVTVTSGASNLLGVNLMLQCQVDGTTYTYYDMYPGLTTDGLGNTTTTGYTLNLKTQPMTLPSGTTLNWITTYIEARFSAAGSATLQVAQWGMRKRFA